jgi:hypothetical protein
VTHYTTTFDYRMPKKEAAGLVPATEWLGWGPESSLQRHRGASEASVSAFVVPGPLNPETERLFVPFYRCKDDPWPLTKAYCPRPLGGGCRF